jgi:hypothetical protein
MRRLFLVSPLFALACGSQPPVTHDVSVEQQRGCGACGERTHAQTEGVVFEVDDGRLALFTDFPVEGDHTAMLEVVGLETRAPEVRYHEVAAGRVVYSGQAESLTTTLTRVAHEPRVRGTLALTVADEAGERRVFPEIRLHPNDRVVPTSVAGGGTGTGGQSGGSRTDVTVVVVDPWVDPAPVDRSYDYDYDSGGCEGDTSTDSGGCEGDTSTDSGGCEGDTSGGASGCEGDTSGGASGCEGDVAAQSAVPGLFRLGWPIAVAGWWNRRRRRVADRADSAPGAGG